jgi:hypothetical protein
MGTSALYYGGSADLATVEENPSIYGYGDTSGASDVSSLANTIGQWGTTIASVVTGNPVTSVSTPQGLRTVGAAGSQVVAPTSFSQGSGLLIIAVVVVVAILLLKD